MAGILFLVPYLKASSAINFQWVQSPGGTLGDRANRVVTDGDGNCYITGLIGSDSVMFGSNAATNSAANGLDEMFVAKFDRHGSNLWVRTAGGVNSTEGRSVAVDGSGNVYVTGGMRTDSVFGPTNLVLQGFSDVFIAKYDPSGNFLWVRQAWDTSYPYAEGLAICARGTNIHVVGQCWGGTMNFGGVLLTNTQLFLAKYDDAGNLSSASSIGYGPSASGYNSPYAYDVTVDENGNCYVASDFKSAQITIGGTTIDRIGSQSDGLVTKWDANGNLMWFKQAGGLVGWCMGVRLNANGNVTVLGRTIAQGTFAGVPVGDGFLASLSSTGGVLWVKSISTNTANTAVSALASDLAGNSFISGTIYSGVAFIGGQFVTNNSLVSLPFIAKFNTSGSTTWIKSASPLSTNSSYNEGRSIDVAPSGAIYIAGFAESALQFDSFSMTNQGRSDILLVRTEPESPVLSINRLGTNALLSWTTNQLGFLLERHSLFESGWTQVTNPAVRLGSEFVSTNATPGPTEYFRLKLEQ